MMGSGPIMKDNNLYFVGVCKCLFKLACIENLTAQFTYGFIQANIHFEFYERGM